MDIYYSILKLKIPINYGKITLILANTKGDYHMFTSIKKQLGLTDSMINDIFAI